MRFQLENSGGVNVVRTCEAGLIRVGDRDLRTSCILTADRIVAPWAVGSAETLTEDDLAPVLELAPEVILLGTGPSAVFPAARLRARIQSKQIGFECMDTPAACRTYNILLSEDRRVAAALIL